MFKTRVLSFMRGRQIVLQFLALVLVIFMISCTGSMVPYQKKKPEPKLESYSEDLSIFLPKVEESVKSEPSKVDVKTTEKKEASANYTPKSQNAEVEIALEKMVELNKKLASGIGYRIQVYTGNNKADFENAKMYLLRNFPDHEIYESYSQPTYRLKMGDFISQLEANTILEEIKARFTYARLVGEKINTKKAIETR